MKSANHNDYELVLFFQKQNMDEFSKLSYRELQQIAKTAGVKANLPKAEILKALRDNAANGSFLTDDEDPPLQQNMSSGNNSKFLVIYEL